VIECVCNEQTRSTIKIAIRARTNPTNDRFRRCSRCPSVIFALRTGPYVPCFSCSFSTFQSAPDHLFYRSLYWSTRPLSSLVGNTSGLLQELPKTQKPVSVRKAKYVRNLVLLKSLSLVAIMLPSYLCSCFFGTVQQFLSSLVSTSKTLKSSGPDTNRSKTS